MRDIPEYLFAGLEQIRDRTRRERGEILDLSIGDPDLPTPKPIVEALAVAAGDPANHRYPTNRGLPELRERAAGWFKRRFGVDLDPDREVLCLLGSKEGLAHLPVAVCDPGDAVLVPDPAYPVYRSAALMAGAMVHPVELTMSDGFLMDVGSGLEECGEARLCYLNYPNNPTGAVADLDYYRGVVEAAGRKGCLICSDAAYSEITYEGGPSPSILQVEGAKDIAVELHSFSKTFNMTGWRVALAVGNAEMLRCLESVKSNMDSGVFQAVQLAAVRALDLLEEERELENRAVYASRKDLVVSALKDMGCKVFPPRGALYVWGRVPDGVDSLAFAKVLLQRGGISVAPGSGFGAAGEGYFRISLTVPDGDLKEALDRMRELELWPALN